MFMVRKNKILEVLEKIKTEKIQPEARWKILWKNYLFWGVWGGMLFLGAVFFSLIILNFLDLGPEIFYLMNFPLGRIIHLLMATTPFVWLGLVLIALFSGLLALRKTKWGYRYNLLLITSLSVLAISLLGGVLHFSKFNQRVGGRFYQNIPREESWAFPAGKRWRLPEDGFLGGKVLEIKEDFFLLEGFNREVWEISFDNKTDWRVARPLKKEAMVGVLGEKIGEKKFKAILIKEFFPREMPFHNDWRLGGGMSRHFPSERR